MARVLEGPPTALWFFRARNQRSKECGTLGNKTAPSADEKSCFETGTDCPFRMIVAAARWGRIFYSGRLPNSRGSVVGSHD